MRSTGIVGLLALCFSACGGGAGGTQPTPFMEVEATREFLSKTAGKTWVARDREITIAPDGSFQGILDGFVTAYDYSEGGGGVSLIPSRCRLRFSGKTSRFFLTTKDVYGDPVKNYLKLWVSSATLESAQPTSESQTQEDAFADCTSFAEGLPAEPMAITLLQQEDDFLEASSMFIFVRKGLNAFYAWGSDPSRLYLDSAHNFFTLMGQPVDRTSQILRSLDGEFRSFAPDGILRIDEENLHLTAFSAECGVRHHVILRDVLVIEGRLVMGGKVEAVERLWVPRADYCPEYNSLFEKIEQAGIELAFREKGSDGNHCFPRVVLLSSTTGGRGFAFGSMSDCPTLPASE